MKYDEDWIFHQDSNLKNRIYIPKENMPDDSLFIRGQPIPISLECYLRYHMEQHQ